MKQIKIILLFTILGLIGRNAFAQDPKSLQENYRVIVSFYSIGSGSDYKAVERFKAFLENYNAKHTQKLMPEVFPWGREGEVDFCFKLKGLKKKSQCKLVQQMHLQLKDAQYIHIEENKPCLHIRN
jgi:hypothetical protein